MVSLKRKDRKAVKIAHVDTEPAIQVQQTNDEPKGKGGLFSPFRALGYISGSVPLAIQQRGTSYVLTSAIASSFQIYGAEKMNLLFVGNSNLNDICALGCYKDSTLVAAGSALHVFERARLVKSLNVEAKLHSLMVMGPLALGLDEKNVLTIWDLTSTQFFNSMIMMPTFVATAMVHPSTYVNKVLFGSQQGTLQLWNINTMKLLYQFKSLGAPITCLVQSPSIDVVAIGTSDGLIVLHNIKMDKELFRFKQDGAVTAMSFRTDPDSAMMASASSNGDLAIWDLENHRIVYKMKGIHDASIHTCFFFVGLPILLTASGDNSIKQWAFDDPDQGPRILRQRVGHHKPPSRIRYYGQDGHYLLSAGQDQSLYCFSVIRDAQHVELSQGSLLKKAKRWNTHMDTLKLARIVDFDLGSTRVKEWDNVVTCHFDDPVAHLWSTQRKAIGKIELASTSKSIVKAVALTHCGNFALLGKDDGSIDKFNVQSGLVRGSSVASDSHAGAITSIKVDPLNKFIYTSSTDKSVKVWDFKTLKCLDSSLTFDFSVSKLELFAESGLLLIGVDDYVMRLVDTETKKIVRKFAGHKGKLTDMAFSPDGRWIVSSSMDGTLLTWDIPTGYCIDGFKSTHIITSVAFSPRGDFIATTHADQLGIFLWANKAMYASFEIKPMTWTNILDLPAISASSVHLAAYEPSQEMEIDVEQVVDLNDSLIKFSSFPTSKWQNLLHLDAIKQRNKPKEAPKAPERLPFFLSLLDPSKPDEGVKTKKQASLEDPDSVLAKLLESCDSKDDYSDWFEYMSGLGPSQVDLQIRMLSQKSQSHFLSALLAQLNKKECIDLTLAYLSVFLKVHSDNCVNEPLLKTLKISVEAIKDVIEHPVLFCLSVLDFITN